MQAIYQEMQAKDVNVVGIVMGSEKDALEIVNQQGVEYTNIVPDQKFNDDFTRFIQAFPTTFLVNDKGEIQGKPIIGSQSKAHFKQLIEKQLAE